MATKKFYNPYSFPVRVKNDLNQDQILAPYGGHGKVLGNEYDQSALVLVAYDHKGRLLQKKVPGLDFNLKRLLREDLIKLAWSMCVDGEMNGKTKKEMVEIVEEKLKEWKQEDKSLSKKEDE